jgi:hypothetical protein
MYEIGNSEARPRKRWRVASIAAGLLGAVVLCQPDSARAQLPLGGGFPGGGLQAGEVHGGVAGGHQGYGYFYGYVDRDGHGWSFGGSYPDYGNNDDSQPSEGQVWYDCSDLAGHYPYLTQRNPVPATGTVSQNGEGGFVVGGGLGGGSAGFEAGGFHGP